MTELANLIQIIWLIFWVYWFASAFTAKKTVAHNFQQFFGFRIIAFILVIAVVRWLKPTTFMIGTTGVSHSPVILGLAFALFILGLALAVWARLHLGRNWGMPTTLKQDPELVTSGPYAAIRHPIYSGIILALIGTALATNLLWLGVAFVVGAYFVYCAKVEEKSMIHQFPKEYPSYMKHSKMLIPYIY
jgi:protein-S-isoprenylcysteine O-methyltransferase Ste14